MRAYEIVDNVILGLDPSFREEPDHHSTPRFFVLQRKDEE